jgi:hypothetical protein
VPVVNEFPDVFPEELPGMPPDRDIEFVIECKPGTTPIYKTPFSMTTPELAEWKEHIKELLEKGFIRSSSSPWGACNTHFLQIIKFSQISSALGCILNK